MIGFGRIYLDSLTLASARPVGCGTKRLIEAVLTLLPQPDAPTRSRVSPSQIWKPTPSTASDSSFSAWKYVFRFVTLMSASLSNSSAPLRIPKLRLSMRSFSWPVHTPFRHGLLYRGTHPYATADQALRQSVGSLLSIPDSYLSPRSSSRSVPLPLVHL